MSLKDRIGIDIGRRMRLEEAILWASARGVRLLDIELDRGENALSRLDRARSLAVRKSLESRGVRLGLHTLSAVNVAEFSPFVSEAVDRYLAAYVDAAFRLGAGWVVVHAGYHFTSDRELRVAAGLERLERAAEYAEKKKILLLLENLNKEPSEAEVHYLAHTLAEWRYYFERIGSPALRLAFTVNHAHLVPEGVAGFLDALDMGRVAEVRLADSRRGGREVHWKPGAGDLDFADLFRRIEAKGFAGHYMTAFGTLDEMLEGRETLAALAACAGVG